MRNRSHSGSDYLAVVHRLALLFPTWGGLLFATYIVSTNIRVSSLRDLCNL